MQKKRAEITSLTNQATFSFFQAMADRMDFSYERYGDYRCNYKGEYDEEFLKDVIRALRKLVTKWKWKGTSARGNAVIFCIERLLFYLAGGNTKGPVERGNSEFLIDAANALMIEFTRPQIPGAEFRGGDDGKSPGFCGFSEREASNFREREGD